MTMSVKDIIPWRRGGRRSSTPARRESGHPMFSLQSDINHALEDFWSTFETPMMRALQSDTMDEDIPKVDVRETDQEVDVIAELPGMDEDDVEVSVADGALIIRGEKESEAEDRDEDYVLRERRFGYIERVVPLPDNLELDTAEATFKNGLLTIRIPKQAGQQSARKRVSVKRQEGGERSDRGERGERSERGAQR
jgi:HSP20 family protein